jgi:alpha-tubulin suppressor-like RCC1 family protein
MKRLLILKKIIAALILLFLQFHSTNKLQAQNSLIGDGFGGRSWYVAYNYHVGSYSGFTVCGTNNQLYGWGNNVNGELGNGLNVSTTAPVASSGMTDVIFFTAGYITSAIRKDSTAWAWGYLTNANGDVFVTTNPKLMLSNVKFVDAGIGHIVFIKHDSTVWAAGQNNAGQLGNGTTTPSAYPVQMTNVQNAVRAISLGFGSGNAASIILLANGTVKLTGGYPWFSQTNNRIPIIVPGLSNIVDIKGCASAAYVLNKAGEVFSFGSETQYGSLGLGLGQASYTAPTKISFPAGASPIVALAATSDGTSALALDEDGKVYGWGGNFTGQIGDGTYTNRSRPVLVATGLIDISAGETFSYIIKSDKTLWATGQNAGLGSSGSIWMNLPNVIRNVFNQIDPTIAPMNLCAPKPFGIIVNPPTLIIDSSCNLDINIKVYPVPSHHSLTVSKNATLCKVSVNIYNAIGQLMVKGKIINAGNNEIDLSNFASGVYFAQFISNGRVVEKKKFIKE